MDMKLAYEISVLGDCEKLKIEKWATGNMKMKIRKYAVIYFNRSVFNKQFD